MLDATAIRLLKDALRRGIENREVAGANLLVIQDGQEAFYHEDGLAELASGRPMTRDAIVRLYSMTKPVTAAAAMLLVERGIVDLFDPVSRYLPGFRNQRVEEGDGLVPVQREVNVHDLLFMTSGLVYGGFGRAGRETEQVLEELDRRLLGDSPMSTLEAMNRIGEVPLAFQPGASWAYGISADVLGAVVEVASGMRFGEFLRKEFFEPLGMTDTGFWVPEEKRARFASTYGNDENGDLTLYTGNNLGIVNRMDRDPAFESGGAGLASTIDDYAKFAGMLMNEGSLGDVRIMQPRTVRYLTSGTLTAEQQRSFASWHTLRGHSYGHFMRVMTDAGQAGFLGSPGEYGWDGWLGAYFCNCPREKLTFLLMMQKKDAGTTPLTRRLRNIVLSAY